MLATFRKDQRIDEKRIHLAGHSNGGAFTCLLWQQRHGAIASVAVVAGGLSEVRGHANPASLLQPKPVMQIAGKQDDVFPFEAQMQMIAILKKVNRSAEPPVPWGNELSALYPSTTGAPLVTYIHPGGHNVPKESLPLMIQFFKEHHRQ